MNRSKKYSAGIFMTHMGITTYIDPQHTIAHKKIMILAWEQPVSTSLRKQ